MKYIMALDQGTTSSRCILFDHNGNICSSVQKEFRQIYPQPGWVEHDANEIWDVTLEVSRAALDKLDATAADVAAIGITNQRETTIIWDKETGEPIANAIVWQCRRTADMIEKIVSDGYTDMIREKTGLVPDPYFSASKIAWILENVPGVRERAERGELYFGTVDTWLIYNLTRHKVHVTDYTNAARTMLFNIHTLTWDEDLLKLFNIPKSLLPDVQPSSTVYGHTDEAILGGEIPISGAAGDQQAALFGQCCFAPGDVKNTYGTGCFLLMNTGNEAILSRHGLVTTIAASLPGHVEYALEGSVFIGGAVIQWLRDEMREFTSAALSEKYAVSVADTDGVYLVPAFTGMGAPYWNPYAKGVMVGITRGCKKEHFVRAALESIAFQTADLIWAMEDDLGRKLTGLKVDGGASANNFLMQFQADLVNAEAHRPQCIETTALGAAYLAGLAVGFWKDKEEIRGSWQLGRSFSPEMEEEKRTALIRGWKRAVRCALAWADDSDY